MDNNDKIHVWKVRMNNGDTYNILSDTDYICNVVRLIYGEDSQSQTISTWDLDIVNVCKGVALNSKFVSSIEYKYTKD